MIDESSSFLQDHIITKTKTGKRILLKIIDFLFKGGKIQFSPIFVGHLNKDFEEFMRIDKFLWSTRYYKTRNIATEACKKGHIKINNQVVKPSREVFPADKVSLRKDQINYQFTVLDIPESRVGAKLVDIYRKDTTPKEAFERNELLQYAKDHYRKKGTGRPTKKDRRDINDYLEEGTDMEKDEKTEDGTE